MSIISLSDIAFEQIKDNYYWGHYGDFKVIVDISNNYINATHLCGLATNKNGNKKELRKWSRLDIANELINEISSSDHIRPDDLLITITGGQITEIRGTYAHPDLIPHIISWASPKFAAKVSKIVNAHILRDYKESIRIKNQAIDRLEQTIVRIEKQNNEQMELIKAIREENSHIIDYINTITNEPEYTSLDNEYLLT